MKIRFALLLLVATIPATLGAAPKWKPDTAIIQKLESNIKIPKQSYGQQLVLSEYVRFYAGYIQSGHRMIHGELVTQDIAKTKPVGIYIVDSEKEFLVIDDGGCAIVNLTYDVEIDRIVSLRCNGVA